MNSFNHVHKIQLLQFTQNFFYNSFLHPYLRNFTVILYFCSNPQHVGFCPPLGLSAQFILVEDLC